MKVKQLMWYVVLLFLTFSCCVIGCNCLLSWISWHEGCSRHIYGFIVVMYMDSCWCVPCVAKHICGGFKICIKWRYDVRFQVLTVASMMVTVFWDIAAFSLVEIDWHFRGAYCLCHQGIALMIEAVSISEMSVSFNHTACCNIPVDSHLHVFKINCSCVIANEEGRVSWMIVDIVAD
jgi:hypothetical protein